MSLAKAFIKFEKNISFLKKRVLQLIKNRWIYFSLINLQGLIFYPQPHTVKIDRFYQFS